MLTEAATTEIITDPRVGPGWLRLLRLRGRLLTSARLCWPRSV